MIIGIVGSGNVGLGMGSIWAAHGHHVCFSYSRSSTKLGATAAAVGANAKICTPATASEAADVVLLAVHWPQVPEVVAEIEAHVVRKPLLTCVVPWNTTHTGLCLGTDRSAAEEIARFAREAYVVEVLPFLADQLYVPSRRFGLDRASVFYCGDNANAKEAIAALLEELDMEPMDTGDLTSARFLEPAAALMWRLAVGRGEGTEIGLKLIRR
jgi:hypothetical protein